MPLLKFWSGGQHGSQPFNVPACFPTVEPKRVTSVPAAAMLATTPMEKKAKALLVEKQKLQKKIDKEIAKNPTTGRKEGLKRKKTSTHGADDNDNDFFSEFEDTEDFSDYSEDELGFSEETEEYIQEPTTQAFRKLLVSPPNQVNTKLRQLQEQQRDLELTKSRMRVIEGIKKKAELRKQQELLMQNAAMVARRNSSRAFGKTALPRSQTRTKTKEAKMDALEAAAREERIANLESIMLDMMGRKSAETSTKKVRKGKERNFRKKVVSEDDLESSSSDEKSPEESSEESEQEKKPKRKHSMKPKKLRKNKSQEEKKYGTLDSFIKSLRK